MISERDPDETVRAGVEVREGAVERALAAGVQLPRPWGIAPVDRCFVAEISMGS